MTKVKKRVLITLSIVVILLVSILGCLAYLIFAGANVLTVKIHPASYVASQVRAVEKQGGTIEFSEADLNGVIELYLKKAKAVHDLTITGIYLRLSEGKVSVYSPVKYKGLSLVLYLDGQLSIENDSIVFSPQTFKVGKLKLPVKYLLTKLSTYSPENTVLINSNGIILNKSIFPFEVSSLSLTGDVVVATIQKAPVQSVPTTEQKQEQPAPEITPPSSPPPSAEEIKTNLLRRASQELGGVQAEVKTAKEKDIIAKIQNVLGKMIQNPSYPYAPEADAVKAQYNALSLTEKNDLKDAILNNMQTDTMRQIKSTFGL